MRHTDVMLAAERTGVAADAQADRKFQAAALELASQPANSDGHRAAARRAAQELVALALAGSEGALATLLSPDPAALEVTWTVACYQIGDLTPSALRDFSTATEAVTLLAACPEPAHVAAELLASTGTGLRWAALTRLNDQLSFQLPDERTASNASQHGTVGTDLELAEALERWSDQLYGWVGLDEPEVMTGGAGRPAETERATELRFAAVGERIRQAEEALANAIAGSEARTADRVAGIEERTARKVALLQDAVEQQLHLLATRLTQREVPMRAPVAAAYVAGPQVRRALAWLSTATNGRVVAPTAPPTRVIETVALDRTTIELRERLDALVDGMTALSRQVEELAARVDTTGPSDDLVLGTTAPTAARSWRPRLRRER